ncbi:hypothetical protein CATYP_08615 [Corynebacterium atypicum]|uniref:DUF418 domain-containing protein n=2 Tax=Corynebacterium atypicum TaxID=191610 RepID=A0ABN4DDX5_9CORY|nr:hypothetical protein CATYP_08615 [Corynebacterium atypicum]
MVVAHLVDVRGLIAEPLSGFPSALFAVLAGVSLGFLDHGRRLDPARIAVRGLFLIALHFALKPVSGGIYVVLEAFGFGFLALCWLPRARTSVVAVVAGWLAALSTAVSVYDQLLLARAMRGPVLPEIFTFPYPVFAWAAYMAIGLVAHRVLVHSRKAQWITAGVGLALAALGIFARQHVDMLAARSAGSNQLLFTALVNPAAHSGSFVDIATCASGALAVMAICLLTARGVVSFPVRAMGSMSLTSYVAHTVSYGLIIGTTKAFSPLLALATAAGLMLAAAVWHAFFTKGPLEWALSRGVECAIAPLRRLESHHH